jgi:hypothetical protein
MAEICLFPAYFKKAGFELDLYIRMDYIKNIV